MTVITHIGEYRPSSPSNPIRFDRHLRHPVMGKKSKKTMPASEEWDSFQNLTIYRVHRGAKPATLIAEQTLKEDITMAWKARVWEKDRLGQLLTIEGERPSRSMPIDALIEALNRAKENGDTTVSLDGIATLYTPRGGVMLCTEGQM